MPYTQTSTSLGAISSVDEGAWVAIPRGVTPSPAGPIVVIAASAVTDGGVIAIEGRRRTSIGYTGGPTTPVKVLHTVAVTANGNIVVPLKDLVDNGVLPDEIRLNVTDRTDGTYTGAVLTAA